MAIVKSLIRFDNEKKRIHDGLSPHGWSLKQLDHLNASDFKFGYACLYQKEKFQVVLEVDGKPVGEFKTHQDARIALGKGYMSRRALEATGFMYRPCHVSKDGVMVEGERK